MHRRTDRERTNTQRSEYFELITYILIPIGVFGSTTMLENKMLSNDLYTIELYMKARHFCKNSLTFIEEVISTKVLLDNSRNWFNLYT